jgi:hypothetical protein
MENITLYSSDVILCEKEDHPDSYFAKFIICDFSRNGNGISIDRETAENWISTLKNKPLVGKIQMKYDGTYDFTGHNMKKVVKKDADGKKYETVEFDTSAFGSFTDVYIEEIDNTEYIVAECEIWKRFTKACEIILSRIEDSTLHTSWEITVEQSKKKMVNGLMTKVIEAGRFIGHCLLGDSVSPAYDCSGMVEIASTNYEDVELSTALSQDLIGQGLDIPEAKEENMAKTQEVAEETVIETPTDVSEDNVEKTTPVAEVSEDENSECKDKKEKSEEEDKDDKEEKETSENIENSSLTVRDLRKKINEECRKKYRWFWINFMFPTENYVLGKTDEDDENELDYVKFTYSVGDDGTITVGEPEKVTLTVSVAEVNTKIAEKDDAIVQANAEIQTLKAENETLISYKERCEKEDAEKAENEIAEKQESLRQYALDSKQITKAELDTDEFKTIISELDETKLKSIVADRVVASLSKKKETIVETSSIEVSETPKANIDVVEDISDYRSAINSFLGK